MVKQARAKVTVIEGFALPGQGYYREGTEVVLHFARNQSVGVLTPERYGDLLARGKIKPIEKEVRSG